MNRRIGLRHVVPALIIGALVVSIPAVASAQLRWGRPAVPRDGACFYRDAGFRGDYFCVRAGQDLSWIPAGLNDEISSIRTFGRAEVTVYRDRRFSGRSERFERDIVNLRNEGWNDKLSSLRVDRDRGGWRDGDRDRGRGDGYGWRDGDRRDDRRELVRAEEVVRRAYLAVFRREPDGGSRGYVDRVMRENLTQADVERELRRSPEYRQRR
ncbi:MAG: peptidase inhibitor family I36 protein [Vicinamibacteraceae bacterium]